MAALFKFAIAALTIYAFWSVLRPKWDVQIVVENGFVTRTRGIPASKRSAVEAFLLHDVNLEGRHEVLARRDRSGRLTIHLKGNLDDGLKQQIRNYLMASL